MKELDQGKVLSRREVHIPINLKGLYNGYTKIFFDAPVNAFDWLTRNIERATKKMTTGFAAAVTLPLGIMTRNAATVANQTLNTEREGRGGKYSGWGSFGAVVGAGAAMWFTGAAIFAKIGLVSSIGNIGAAVVAGVLAAPIIAPALAVGMVATAALMGVGAFALSTVPAVANIRVGISRTWDRIRGVKYSPEMLQQLSVEASRDSISTQHDEEKLRQTLSKVSSLPEESQLNILGRLQHKFKDALEKKKEAEEKAAATAAPAASAPKP